MNYWMLCLPRPDMEHCIKIGSYGLKRALVINNVKADDKLVLYVSRECKVIALGTVTKGFYRSSRPVFRAAGNFDFRFDFQSIKTDPELDFKTLLDKLPLTKDSRNWGGRLRMGIANISSADWSIIDTTCFGDTPLPFFR